MSDTPKASEEFDHELQPPELVAALDSSLLQRSRRLAGILGQFLVGQGAAQGASILANLFLVHTLSVEAYAQFGLALGFQTAFATLMDMGFASTIVPLVADRRDDKGLVGRYVRSALHLRNRSFAVMAPVAAIAFLAIMHRRHWSAMVRLLLVCSVLLSLYSGGVLSSFSAPLFLFRRLKDYYLPQAVFGVVRLAAYLVLAVSTGVSGWVAAGLNALYLVATAHYVRNKSQRYLSWPESENPEVDREMVRYILPAIPAILFSAFQTQISLFLIGIFGGTAYIAQVAALTRIGQIFTLLLTMFVILVEPYVARLERTRLLRHYLAFQGLTAVACVPLVFVAFRWPAVYLLIIGAKYEAVGPLMGWYVVSAAISLMAGVGWIMNRARKWVFWSGSILEIGLVLAVQALFLMRFGVKNTESAVFFNLATSVCIAVTHAYVAIVGFVRGPRLQEGQTAI